MLLNAKAQFQSQEENNREWLAISHKPAFHSACTHALASMVETTTISAEQIQGAKAFINALLNLTEKEASMPAFPTRRLNFDDEARKTTQPTKK